MNVVDLPQQATPEEYEQAVTRYAAMVKGRAIGVHRLGHLTQAGLSDIDLLVVTDHTAVDNRYFFSAFQRLPSRYHRLFLHEPYILPAWSLRVMQYTTHSAPQLAAGRDVIAPYAPAQGSDERWCRTLESYCAYAAFHHDVKTSGVLRGRQTIAAASSLRYLLADASAVMPEAADDAYCAQIGALRERFFETNADPDEKVRTAWDAFSNAFQRVDTLLRERFGTSSTAETVVRARKRLAGEEECAEIDREYAFRRARDIDGYHQELASLGLPFGHLFFTAAYPQALRTLPSVPLVDSVVSNVYRMRRRLTEYAAGA